MRNSLLVSALASALLTLGGCASTADSPSSDASTATPAATAGPSATPAAASVASATANMSAASGSLVSGKLTLRPVANGVQVSGQIGGMTANRPQAFHIHEKGDCSAADASSAGGHFNPTAQPHGRASHGAHHLGDNDNLVSNGEGVVTVNTVFQGVTLGGGGANDVVGKAIVVHAAADDYTSQPAGNAGARVACGVINPG